MRWLWSLARGDMSPPTWSGPARTKPQNGTIGVCSAHRFCMPVVFYRGLAAIAETRWLGPDSQCPHRWDASFNKLCTSATVGDQPWLPPQLQSGDAVLERFELVFRCGDIQCWDWRLRLSISKLGSKSQYCAEYHGDCVYAGCRGGKSHPLLCF